MLPQNTKYSSIGECIYTTKNKEQKSMDKDTYESEMTLLLNYFLRNRYIFTIDDF